MKKRKIYLLTIACFAVTSVTSFAQRQRSGEGAAPIEVGSELADVTAYLEDGSAYALKEKLSGKHAVLVFGCLT